VNEPLNATIQTGLGNIFACTPLAILQPRTAVAWQIVPNTVLRTASVCSEIFFPEAWSIWSELPDHPLTAKLGGGRKRRCAAQRVFFHGLEAHFFRHAAGDDPACFLPKRRLLPARLSTVVAANIKCVADGDRPDPDRCPVRRRAIVAEGRDMQVVRFSNLTQFVF
jgi:hypothetical protein